VIVVEHTGRPTHTGESFEQEADGDASEPGTHTGWHRAIGRAVFRATVAGPVDSRREDCRAPWLDQRAFL